MSFTSSRQSHHVSSVVVREVGVKESGEVISLKEGNAKITNIRAMIGLKTYSMSNIDTVRLHVHEPKLFVPIFFYVDRSSVQVRSSIRELNILEASDRDAVERIVSAMNEAIFLKEESK